jgi:hypothetical protein
VVPKVWLDFEIAVTPAGTRRGFSFVVCWRISLSRSDGMRHLVYGLLTGLLLATQAAAQSGSSADTSKMSEDPMTKGGKASPAKTGQASEASPAPQAAPAAKDDSLTNYDVNGSNASDAMGASR